MGTLLYIPGLGSDKLLKIQRHYLRMRCKNRWNLVFFEPDWHTNESYADKWKRLSDMMDGLSVESTHVLAASAGGPLLVRIMSDYPRMNSATCISAKLRRTDVIGQKFRDRAPALVDAVIASEKAQQNVEMYASKVVVYRPIFDTVVALQDMTIPGSKKKRVFAFEHLTGIAMALICHFPKKLA